VTYNEMQSSVSSTAEILADFRAGKMVILIDDEDRENEGDLAYRRTLTALFDSGLDPVTIIKLKDIVQGLESCADAFEELANVIESLALKES